MKKNSREMSQVLDMRMVSGVKSRFLSLLVISALAALLCPALASATSILGSDLASFAVLGASTVTNTGATTLTANLGVSPGSAITGKETITVNGMNAISNPAVHEADALTILAQSQLAIAKTNLGLLGPGTGLGVNLTGLTLSPGVYTVSAGTTNLSEGGILTLDGLYDPNAFWVFQMDTLITSSASKVNVINTGTGAGVFWNVASSATLGTTTAFEGNILALTSVTLNTGATIGCGRALASTGAVTMAGNTISSACTELLAGTGIGAGSNGFSGSGLEFDNDGKVVVKEGGGPAPVPEPGTFLLLGAGLAGLVAFRKRFKKA